MLNFSESSIEAKLIDMTRSGEVNDGIRLHVARSCPDHDDTVGE
jgi:hypothetical protein